jgi:hypothetical protein
MAFVMMLVGREGCAAEAKEEAFAYLEEGSVNASLVMMLDVV